MNQTTEATGTGQSCVLRHKRRAQADVGLVCNRHLADVREMLVDIRDLWQVLPTAERPTSSHNKESARTKNPFPAAPLNLSRLAIHQTMRQPATVMRTPTRNLKPGIVVKPDTIITPRMLESNGADVPDVPRVLDSWCALVRDERKTAVASLADIGPADLASALLPHVPWLAGTVWITDFSIEMTACRQSLLTAIGDDPDMPKPMGLCPYCDDPLYTDRDRQIRDLRRSGKAYDDTDIAAQSGRVRCVSCSRSWSNQGGGPSLRHLNLMLEADAPPRRPRLQSGITGNGGRP